MADISSGKHVFIQELVDNPQKYKNTSIRVVGMLTDYHAGRNTATMVFKNASLRLDTELVDVYVPDGCLVQCIGELAYDWTTGQLTLKSRTLRNLELMDVGLYEQMVVLSRQYDATSL